MPLFNYSNTSRHVFDLFFQSPIHQLIRANTYNYYPSHCIRIGHPLSQPRIHEEKESCID